jgi:hypothetical protein
MRAAAAHVAQHQQLRRAAQRDHRRRREHLPVPAPQVHVRALTLGLDTTFNFTLFLHVETRFN